MEAPLGPAPVLAEPPGAPARRVLAALRVGARPATIRELADELGGHPNTVRLHLQRLVADGWVLEETRPAAGRGRPARVYRAAPHAEAAEADPVAEEYLGLATAFAEHLSRGEAPGEEARQVGRLWGARLASRRGARAVTANRDHADADPAHGSPAAPGAPGEVSPGDQVRAREQALSMLEGLGFSPLDDGPERPVLLRTCPLLAAARANPEVICTVHLGLVEGALEARGGSGEGVSLVPFAAPGSCHLRVPAPPR